MSSTSLKESEIEKAIMAALKKLGGSAGLSLEDIKDHLTSLLDIMPDVGIIETCLNGAVDKEIVSVSDGKYKLRECKMTVCFCGCGFVYMSSRPNENNSEDKMKKSAGKASEGKGKNEKAANAEKAAGGKGKNEETAKRPSSMTKKNKFCIIC